MKLSDARNSYYGYTADASAVARQIAFAGVAVIWLFNAPIDGKAINLPSELTFVALLLVISLSFDLLQYVIASLIWGIFSRKIETQNHSNDDDPDCLASPFMNWPTLFFFWGKILFLICAYYFLAQFLISHI